MNTSTGKTLLAFKLAKEAIDNQWTFIYLKEPKLLAQTLRMCKAIDKSSKGIIVFAEDIDQITSGERGEVLQDILNTLDGGDSKDMNVISLFTTNHLEKINPTFLRGKRIGSIIEFGAITAETAEKYFDHMLSDVTLEGDFGPIYQEVAKYNIVPAFMVEIIENVKSNMVLRGDNVVKDLHVMTCIKSYVRQMNLSQVSKDTKSKEEKMVSSIKDVLFNNPQTLSTGEKNYIAIEMD